MRITIEIVRRNIKVFFKDKGMFISALITPMILLVLYATFLAGIYKDSFLSAFPEGFVLDEKIVNSAVAGQLISSLLAVCCITVAFCSNLVMIGDKARGTIVDFTVSPVKRSKLAIAYFFASAIGTLIVTLVATGVCLGYLATQGFYMSGRDVFELILAVIILTLFGTSLSSCIHFFLSTDGQATAVGTIISAGYGFICGAYMPISSFASGLQKVLGFLPGTYGTSLIKEIMLRGALDEMAKNNVPAEAIASIRKSIDVDIFVFDNPVNTGTKYIVMTGAVVFFTAIFVVLNLLKKKNK